MNRLSVCIPSYNRAAFLPDLLTSLAEQYEEGVEAIVCDNGSTDDTENVVRTWQEKHPWIRYERFAKNVGPDLCFLRSVEIASSPFCWLMGDDDVIEPGGLKRVLEALRPDLTGITVARMAYDKDLKTRWEEKSSAPKEDVLFTQVEPCFLSLFCLFGFLSAQVVRRDKWLSIASEEDLKPYYNAYVLVYIIGRMIQKDPAWLYLHIPCIGWRSGNDSFALELGRYKRFVLDVNGYSNILQGLLHKQKLHAKVMNAVISTHFAGHVRDLKFHPGGKGHIFKGFVLCTPRLFSYQAFWSRLLPMLLLPRWTARCLRSIKKKCFGRRKNECYS